MQTCKLHKLLNYNISVCCWNIYTVAVITDLFKHTLIKTSLTGKLKYDEYMV